MECHHKHLLDHLHRYLADLGINVEENLIKINLIKVVDVLSRELNPNTKYKSLLYIYDDGSIRKQFIIK